MARAPATALIEKLKSEVIDFKFNKESFRTTADGKSMIYNVEFKCKGEKDMSAWLSSCCHAQVDGMRHDIDPVNEPINCSKCGKKLGVEREDIYYKIPERTL